MRAVVLVSACLACMSYGSRLQKQKKPMQGEMPNPLKTLASLLSASGFENPAVGWQVAAHGQNAVASSRASVSRSPSAWVSTRRTAVPQGFADFSKDGGPNEGIRKEPQRAPRSSAPRAQEGDDKPPEFQMPDKPVPVTLLSGFLGSGKTTLLRHILQNTEGVRVGVIVNDVAAVNIDSKLVKGGASQDIVGGLPEDMVELSNGCACCSAGDDFFGALAMLITQAMAKGFMYDYIVFEGSGVAEPRLLRRMFQEAEMEGWPIMKYLKLESMVTVVDAPQFFELYSSTDSSATRQDLGAEEDEQAEMFPEIAEMRAAQAPSVVQLLVEQVETSDVIVINKIDKVSEEDLNYLKDVMGVINGFAELQQTTFGQVPPMALLKKDRERGVAMSNEIMDLQSSVDFANWLEAQDDKKQALLQPRKEDEETHEHSHAEKETHEHSHAEKETHEHSHAEKETHEHSHAEKEAHEHGHAEKETHEHSHANAGSEPKGSHESHSHSHHEHNHDSHSHEHSHASGCDDPECTDHSHSHDDRQDTTAAQRFGIKTFVYSQRRPFNTERFEALLRDMPFERLKKMTPRALKEPTEEDTSEAGKDGPFAPVMRSKGFVWLANENVAALYWSQAGKQIEITEMGRWWASLERSQWPEAHVEAILADCKGEYGDRRQELVFIGPNLDKDAIIAALDACLATDEEMEQMLKEAGKEGIPMKVAAR